MFARGLVMTQRDLEIFITDAGKEYAILQRMSTPVNVSYETFRSILVTNEAKGARLRRAVTVHMCYYLGWTK